MKKHDDKSDEWPLESALAVTAGFTLAVIALAHLAAQIAEFFK